MCNVMLIYVLVLYKRWKRESRSLFVAQLPVHYLLTYQVIAGPGYTECETLSLDK